MALRAEVMAIGDELITGQRLDTNSQWLSERLIELGVEVAFHTTIGDNLADNVSALAAAFARAEVIAISGGLGPTADDLTREALARATGVGLVRDEASLDHIRRLFASRAREMPPQNESQADFPAGATPIPNDHGTAPGIAMRISRPEREPCLVFALPGVPAEMKAMWVQSVAPAIAAAQPSPRVIRHRRIKCVGVGESHVESMLPDLIRRGREPSVGITVSDATITLRITAAGAGDSACQAAMEPTAELIYKSLGTLIFGEGDDELEDAVARLLQQQGKRLAVAEWASGGLITQWLTRAAVGLNGPADPSLSAALAAGVTVTSLAALRSLLNVTSLGNAKPDDSAVATAMAEAIRTGSGADLGLGVAAFPPSVDDPEGRIHVSIAAQGRTRRLRFGSATHPAIRQARTAKQALNALRLVLLGKDQGDSP